MYPAKFTPIEALRWLEYAAMAKAEDKCIAPGLGSGPGFEDTLHRAVDTLVKAIVQKEKAADFPQNPIVGQLHRTTLELDYVWCGDMWLLAITNKQRMVNI